MRIRGLLERRRRARPVAFVAPQNVSEDVGLVCGLAPPAQLQCAASGANLGRCGDENLRLGVRTNYRANIAAVEYGSGRPAREFPLETEQRGTHSGNGGNHRRRLPDFVALERQLIEPRRVDLLRGRDGRWFIAGLA